MSSETTFGPGGDCQIVIFHLKVLHVIQLKYFKMNVQNDIVFYQSKIFEHLDANWSRLFLNIQSC